MKIIIEMFITVIVAVGAALKQNFGDEY